jgi:hypothetical protein
MTITGQLRSRLLALGRNVLRYRLADPSIRSDRLGREHMADLAARFVRDNHVEGAYLEFGVWRGSTFVELHRALHRHRVRMPMFAFDSFEGRPGQFGCSVDDFRREMRAGRVPDGTYTVVPGFYERTLSPALPARLGLSRAALVWIDCVRYESAEPVLEFVAPLLQDGTLVMFNDYYRFKGHPELGERRAVAEFLDRYPSISVTDYAKFSSVGQAFIVHTTATVRRPADRFTALAG